ncbi:Tn3 family transposase [Micromonospora sp. ATA51]|nr:Tn3 family transposase [Micromonospora sp. ATA51]
MLCLRVLQAAVVYVNTLMVQDVLAEGLVELGAADRRGLTPLFWTNISPYGEVRLNMANRLALRATTAADPAGGDDDPA